MKHLLIPILLVAVSAAPLSAQQRIRLGQTVQGSLDAGSLKLDDGSYFDLYRYDSRGNETIVILMESSDFDAYLMLGTLDGGNFNQLASDDDGGGGTNSRIEYQITSSGSYYIRANTLEADQTGNYTLRLQSAGLTNTLAGSVKELAIGRTITDRLNSSNEVLSDGSYAQRYRIQLTQNQVVQITLQGDDFDAYLMLQDDTGAVVAQDDDSAGGTDARIDFTAPKTGAYTVIVNSLGREQEGEFALFVESIRGGSTATAAQTATRRPISIGQTLNGTFSAASPTLDDGSHYADYILAGTPNQTVEIHLESDEFDAYLQFGVLTNGQFESITSDDDGGSGTNSRIRHRFTDSRTYVIRANTLEEGETGAFRLRVVPVATSPRVPVADLPNLGSVAVMGATHRLDTGSPVNERNGAYMKDFRLQVAAGQTMTFYLSSSEFDTYLEILDANYTPIAEMDDGWEGTNTQLKHTFTQAGTYVIRCTSYESGETGAFQVSFRREP